MEETPATPDASIPTPVTKLPVPRAPDGPTGRRVPYPLPPLPPPAVRLVSLAVVPGVVEPPTPAADPACPRACMPDRP